MQHIRLRYDERVPMSIPAAASVANQKNSAPHAHSAIAEHGSDPFNPFDPFDPYFQKC